MKTYTPWFRTAVPFYRRAPDGFPMMTLAFVKRVRFADVAVPVAVSDEPTRPIPTTNTKRRRTTMKKLILGALLMVGCGEYIEASTLSSASATTAAQCDAYAVGGNVKCAPRADGTADFVECATYPYNKKTGVYQGDVPVAGCTLDGLASPGVPYTATCVEACPQ